MADPLGGSYLVEAMTDLMERRAEELFAQIDEMGEGSILQGVLEGIDRGWFQGLIAESAFEEQRRYEDRELIQVGVNAFVDPSERDVDTLVIGPQAEASQRAAVARTRAERDPDRATSSLEALGTACRHADAELIGPLLECARARCTEGEIVRAMREVFGGYREAPRF